MPETKWRSLEGQIGNSFEGQNDSNWDKNGNDLKDKTRASKDK